MLYKSYLRNRVVYVPTVGKRGGVYTIIEPVAAVPVDNTDGLRRAFYDTIARKNVPILPSKGTWPTPLLPKYAGAKSWSAFARDASTWSIKENEGGYQIVGHRKHPKGYWVEDPEQKVEFPPGATVEQVIDRMIAILQDAAMKKE